MFRLKPLLALAMLAATAAPALAQTRPTLPPRNDLTSHPLPPFALATPTLTTAALIADLSGIMTVGMPRTGDARAPLWTRSLSERTQALFDQLNELEGEVGRQSFDYDWLCQCRNTRHLRAVPNIIVESATADTAQLHVGLRLYGGQSEVIILQYVYEDGWRIDDIIDEHGMRYSDAMQLAIRDRLQARVPLPNLRRP